jgi:hypothetical protein
MVIKKYTLSCPSCAGKDERIKELEEKLRVHENPKHWPKWKKDFAEDVYGRKIDWDSFKKEG